MLTDEQLRDIEARANAATPGPWTYDRTEEEGDRCVYSEPDGKWIANVGNWLRQNLIRFLDGESLPGWKPSTADIERALKNTYDADDADCIFIAHAREDIPRLLDHIRELEAKRVDLFHHDSDVIREQQAEIDRLRKRRAVVCPKCKGTGVIALDRISETAWNRFCPVCHGSGVTPEEYE